jgi:pyruvate kinase
VSNAHIYRRTKIVATLGPACFSEDTLGRLIQAGVDCFRLNFSHGTHAEFEAAIPRIRRLSQESGHAVALLQDIQGPRLRTGRVSGGGVISLEEGQQLIVTTEEMEGTQDRISIPYSQLSRDLAPGHRMLLADGIIALRVVEVSSSEVLTEVEKGGELGEHKGLNLPDTHVTAEPLTSKDKDDLAFGVRHGVDYVALSFVRRRDDVLDCRRYIHQMGGDAPIIAKIENPQAVDDLESILSVSDGVMVARGDLGVEVSPERVPLLQKRIIRRANELGLPVITATQMLESMVEHTVPTRAEASDVANAILDGTDAVMLSAETAVGKHPVATVETMVRIAREAEPANSIARTTTEPANDEAHALARAAKSIAIDLETKAIAVFTKSGRSAKVLASVRPFTPVYAFTGDPAVFRRLALWYGITPVLIEPLTETEAMVQQCLEELSHTQVVAPDDQVVVMGSAPKVVGGLTNLVTVRTVGA